MLCLGMLETSDKEVGKALNDIKVCQKWLWLKCYLAEKLPDVLDGRI